MDFSGIPWFRNHARISLGVRLTNEVDPVNDPRHEHCQQQKKGQSGGNWDISALSGGELVNFVGVKDIASRPADELRNNVAAENRDKNEHRGGIDSVPDSGQKYPEKSLTRRRSQITRGFNQAKIKLLD